MRLVLVSTFLLSSIWALHIPTEFEEEERQKRANDPKIWVLGSISSDYQTSVYECFIEEPARYSVDEHVTECCAAIHRVPVHVLDRAVVKDLCPRQLARLPKLEPEKFDVHPSRKLPLAYLIESQPMTKPFSVEPPEAISKPGPGEEGLWQHFLWDDFLRQAVWFGSHQKHMEHFFQTKKLLQLDDDFPATISTTLEDTGGIHPKLRHRIHIGHRRGGVNAELDLYILLQIPSDMFIVTEDAIEHDTKYTFEIITNGPLDEEEPAFASPPHAVFIHLEGYLKEEEFEFTTKLHMRYPQPLKGDAFYNRIVMLSPTLIAGLVIDMNTDEELWQLEPQGIDLVELAAPMVTWAAAGTESDYKPIVSATLALFVIGGMLTLFSILRLRARAMRKGKKE